MKRKSKLFLCLCCAFLCTMPISATASDETLSTKAKNTITAYIEDGAVSSVYTLHNGGASSDAASAFNVHGYDMEQLMGYCTFDCSAEEYYKAGNLSVLFEDNMRYYVPYENANATGMIMLCENEDGILEVVQHTASNALQKNEILDTAWIQDTVTDVFSEEVAAGIQYVEDAAGEIRLAYFTAKGTEYVMPFFISRFEDSYEGITQGDIYTAADFMTWVGSRQSTPYSEEEFVYGGINSSTTVIINPYDSTGYDESTSFLWLYPVISGILLVGIGAGSLVMLRKGKNMKHFPAA